MAELPLGITEAELEEYAALDAAIKRASARREALNRKIKESFTKKGTYVFGKVVIKLGMRKQVDRMAVVDDHPYDEYPNYYRTTPTFDPTLVPKDVLAGYETEVQTLSVSVAD